MSRGSIGIPFPLYPGRMRHEITVEVRAAGTGSRGQDVGDWESQAKVFGMIRSLTGREFEQVSKKWEEVEREVIMYLPTTGLDSSANRLQFENRVWRIGYIEDVDEMHTMVRVLVAEEK